MIQRSLRPDPEIQGPLAASRIVVTSMLRSCMSPLLLPLLAFASAPLAAQKNVTYEQFLQRFKQARELNDQKAVHKVLRANPDHAIAYFKIQVDAFAQRNSQEAGDMVETMRDLWKEVWGSELLYKIERMRATLDPTEIAICNKLLTQRGVAWKLFQEAKESKKERQFRNAMEGMRKCAESFEELGDKYEAGICWLYLVNIIEGYKDRNPDDLAQQVQAMDLYLQLCEDWDWTKHREYQLNKAWSKGLHARLENPKAEAAKPGAEKEGESAAGLIPYKPGSKWATVDLKHSVAKKATEGISVYASANPLYWFKVLLEDKNEKELKQFQDGTLIFKRAGAAKFQLLPKSLAEGRDIRFYGLKRPTELWYEKSDADGKYETNYSMFLWTGGQQEAWCGTTLNLSPSWKPNQVGESRALLAYRSASNFTADIAGEKVTLYDENANGVFGDKAGTLAMNDYRLGGGFDDAVRHPLLDSMRVGKRGSLVPFSPFVEIKGAWYAMRAIKNNEQLRFRELDPSALQTGRVVLKYKGPGKAKPKHLIVRPTTGTFAEAMFDIAAAGGKGLEVPAGTYEVFYGRVYGGRAPKNADCVILKGGSKSFEVKVGETTVLEMGAPFSIDYVPERGADEVTVDSSKMWVVDKLGAKWTCLVGEILEPDLVVARDKNGRGAKTLASWRMFVGRELEDVRKNYPGKPDLMLATFAVDKNSKSYKFDVTAKIPYKGVSYIGVRQKKHKLFGKLNPIWK